LRGIPIGDLQLHESASRRWTDDELALVNAVVDQVAQAAEAIRLLDESQERATREQLIGQITNKMRRATDLENLMEVTVAELARVLEPARTFVQMDLKPQTSAQPQPGKGSPVKPNQPLNTPITEGEEA
jgi:GAF domain-containing protein